DRGTHERPVHRGGRPHADDRFVERGDEKGVYTIADDLRHRSPWMGDHRRSTRHCLDDAEAERLVEGDEVEEGPRSGEELAGASRTYAGEAVDALRGRTGWR